MQPALLCALLLLASRGDASARPEGELCRGWASATGSPGAAFQCPQLRDGADAHFCCGTCSLPFCCASGEARLEQQQCPRAGRQEARLMGRPRTTQLSTQESDDGWKIAVVVVVLAAFCWSLCITARCYRDRCCCFQRNQNVFGNMQTWEAIYSARHRNPPPRIENAPPSYMDIYPLPSTFEDTEDTGNLPALSPAVSFQRANPGNPGGKCTLGPFVHRHVPDRASEPALEAASLVDQRCPERERSTPEASNAGESEIPC